jgi:uncharacterized membrane protein YadS
METKEKKKIKEVLSSIMVTIFTIIITLWLGHFLFTIDTFIVCCVSTGAMVSGIFNLRKSLKKIDDEETLSTKESNL